jgi:hypothetical protein
VTQAAGSTAEGARRAHRCRLAGVLSAVVRGIPVHFRYETTTPRRASRSATLVSFRSLFSHASIRSCSARHASHAPVPGRPLWAHQLDRRAEQSVSQLALTPLADQPRLDAGIELATNRLAIHLDRRRDRTQPHPVLQPQSQHLRDLDHGDPPVGHVRSDSANTHSTGQTTGNRMVEMVPQLASA